MGDWAPDASRLVLSSDREGSFDLYVVAATAGAPVRITSMTGAETNAAWSPDGTTVAFSNNREGDTEVFAVRPDGGDERRLTNNASEDLVMDWQPLRDTRPPVVRALPSTGVRGRTVRLRFMIDEESGLAAVEFEARFPRGGVRRRAIDRPVRPGARVLVRHPRAVRHAQLAGDVPLLRRGDRSLGEHRRAELRALPLREAALGERLREHREAAQARGALGGRPHGGEVPFLEVAARPEALAPGLAARAEGH